MACGTGKTFVGLRVYENLKADLTVIFVPTLQLVAQLKREWEQDRRRPFVSLVVCSDQTVVDGEPFRAVDMGLAPTTDPALIADFMGHPGTKVVFCTYQSSDKIAEAQFISGVDIDLIVCDEAHRTTGIQGNGYFQTPLEQGRLRAQWRLFMTATPRMFSERAKSRADNAGVELVGMDDEAVYGPVAIEYPFPQAIEDKVLCDYRLAVVVVTDDEVQESIQNHEFLAHQHRQMLVEDVAKHVGVAKAIKRYGLKRILGFVNRIETGASYANDQSARGLLPTVATTGVVSPGLLWSDYVEGGMSVAQRQLRLDVLGNPRQDLVRVLYSARCLTEGIDTPAMDGIAFLDHRKSVVDVAQGAGRCLRLPPDWDGQGDPPTAYIVIPFFVPKGEDRESIRESESFARMVEILRAMKSHDQRLEAWIDRVALEVSGASSGEEAPVDLGGLSPLSVRDIVSAVNLQVEEPQRVPRLNEQEIVAWAQAFHDD
jgi:predicted helicase